MRTLNRVWRDIRLVIVMSVVIPLFVVVLAAVQLWTLVSWAIVSLVTWKWQESPFAMANRVAHAMVDEI